MHYEFILVSEIIDLPERRTDRPRRDFLEWHIGEVFKAS
jgi:hypothetical protein